MDQEYDDYDDRPSAPWWHQWAEPTDGQFAFMLLIVGLGAGVLAAGAILVWAATG
jgi:hypothetical protein